MPSQMGLLHCMHTCSAMFLLLPPLWPHSMVSIRVSAMHWEGDFLVVQLDDFKVTPLELVFQVRLLATWVAFFREFLAPHPLGAP